MWRSIERVQEPEAAGTVVKRLHNALIFRGETRYDVIPLEEISHLAASGRTTIIHCREKTVTAKRLLKDMEARLPDTFLRVHKGFVVNTRFVRGLQYIMGGMYQITLCEPRATELPVGRVYAPAVKACLARLGEEFHGGNSSSDNS